MLKGVRVAILVADGFEQIEMTEPRKALEQRGAQTRIVSPEKDEVEGWNHFDKGERFAVDVPLEEARADDFDALLLPGGVANPDQLRLLPLALAFVKAFFVAGKPVGVICHGPWTLIEAGHRSGPISSTPARAGPTRRSWSITGSSRVENLPTCLRSTANCSRSSPSGGSAPLTWFGDRGWESFLQYRQDLPVATGLPP